MTEVGVHEAKTYLARLLRRVAAGEEIVITNGGRPVARLVPIHSVELREVDLDQERLQIPDDFDAPLPAGVIEAFTR